MALSVGIVGLPNVGKSTLFNALLQRELALVAEYPFATIEPNVGVVSVPDERVEKLATWFDSQNPPPRKHATVKFIDIAGLVKGAAQGEGLGNQFLAHIREVTAILEVIRDFTAENIDRAGSVNPEEDTAIIETELLLKDLETVEKRLSGVRGKPQEKALQKLLEAVGEGLSRGIRVLDQTLTVEEREEIKDLSLLTAKPFLYAFNIDEGKLSQLDKLPKTFRHRPVVYLAAKFEAELADFSQAEQQAYLENFGVSQVGLERLIESCYQLLNLISFFTIRRLESRAYPIVKGTTAQEAGREIHSDFVEKFIRAEVISWQELPQHASWKAAKNAGAMRLEGKDYIVNDGDVINYLVGS